MGLVLACRWLLIWLLLLLHACHAANDVQLCTVMLLCLPCWCSMDDFGPEESMDESLLYVTANRVGVFRRGKSKCKVVRTYALYRTSWGGG
jgi:hypothetical protein